MEKILKVKDYEIPVKSHAGILLMYKSNFRRDCLNDLGTLQNFNPTTLEGLDLDVFYRLVWVLAKAYNKDLPPLEIWLESIDVEPLTFVFETVNDVIDLIFSNIQSTVKKK